MADIIDTVDRICIRNDLERDRSIRNYKRSAFHLKHTDIDDVWITLTPPESVYGSRDYVEDVNRWWTVTHPSSPDAEVPFRSLTVHEEMLKSVVTDLITEQVDLRFIKEIS